ncbi:Spx/MgsR family RNA polymerase-binding regulatory protein [Acinetobacter pollinis]|uniref:Spx/MgsR family RNA polymerase-binding regulatory protein n=1 Tax=Acinetobacter pollinis TaxID=2605270 RepID=UPI0018A29C71|nr:Spx/MgsR family RNA polymerase-binding regulatory protein [Acinetobacter pollinis]MBF7690636.1 Spx/MgsR family RNA polymerase-binding regulatory protein [Acinetobacter pollinis]MBF7693349.1 Spx/MgsR family RNA polymerase-binding regulatory protein [Acinetobacter pollinis]MBF7698171.1 Spx/MgsR family RNA polymerase-binding regulatory protein [Acinetobacter pollinis]MBF7701202.1 Spx/MgsR family RNA polymerase-binding regulatory protein [Acinetobacter pollinis]
MLKIYGIKNCSSMKKAFDLLAQLEISYEFHEYKKLGIDEEHLKQWLEEAGQDVILNKKGTTWRKLDAQAQEHALESETQLIKTLQANTSMIKRPVLETPNGLIVGFNEDAYKALKD